MHLRVSWLSQVVKASDAVQELLRPVTTSVHGVAESFLKLGSRILIKVMSVERLGGCHRW